MNEIIAIKEVLESKLNAYNGNLVLKLLYRQELQKIENNSYLPSRNKNGVNIKNANSNTKSPQEVLIMKKIEVENKLKHIEIDIKEVEMFIEKLSQSDKDLIELKYKKRCSYNEIGSLLSYTPQAVHKKINKILRRVDLSTDISCYSDSVEK